jgi:hypothetical protein
METSNTKKIYDRFNYLQYKEHISSIRKKYYQKKKLLKLEEDKEVEESNEYIIQKILHHV